MTRMRTKAAEIREPERDVGVGLSDEELEYVVGGLQRVWPPFTPFADNHTGVASSAPHQGPGAVVDASVPKP